MRITRPQEHEPIRLVTTKSGQRYRAVVNTGVHPNGKRRQATATFDNITAARKWVAETRTRVRHNTYTPPDRKTVDQLCDLWLATRHHVRLITANRDRSVLLNVRARLGARVVQDLRPSDVVEFVGWLHESGGRKGAGLSHRTIVLTLGTMNQMFRYAVAEGLIERSPSIEVKAPRAKPGSKREAAVWTVGELKRFVEVGDKHDLAAAWRLTACGLRRSEVMGLRWQDVDLDTGIISVTQARVAFGSTVEVDEPKSEASRRVVAVERYWPGTIAALKSHKVRQAAKGTWDDSGLVVTTHTGEGLHPDLYSDWFRALCRDAGLPVIRLHEVRHTLSTLLRESGVDDKTNAHVLGHSEAINRNTYQQVTQQHADDAADKFAAHVSNAV